MCFWKEKKKKERFLQLEKSLSFSPKSGQIFDAIVAIILM